MSEIADHQFDPAPVIDTNDSEFKTPPMASLQQGLQQDITTRRNRPKYLYEGALYVYHGMSSKKDAKYWRCEFFNARDIKCRGRLHTDLNDVVIRQIGDHVCNHNAARVEAQRILSGIKRRAMVTTEKPLQIRNQTLQNTPMAVIAAMPSKEATKRMIKRARRGIDMNTLLNPHACPIFKQDNGDHYLPGNMVYTEIDGQRVESFEHIPSDFSKSDGVEEKWPRVGGTYGGGGTPQMGSSTNPHGTIGGVDGYPNNRQETKTGAGRPRKKVKQEYLLPPPQPIAILDRTLPHVFVNRKTNEFSFSCNIAGYTPEELQVELVGAELVISGAHKQQTINQSFTASFSRRILLPEGVHKETIQCSVDDKGLLNVIGQLMHVGKPKTIQQEIQQQMQRQQLQDQQQLQEQHLQEEQQLEQQQQQPSASSAVTGEIDVV
uniref:SHSP domain-containing protein n=2 Tax=Meloidogyne TaxID=189290 RepID=A0A915P1F2_9BILA